MNLLDSNPLSRGLRRAAQAVAKEAARKPQKAAPASTQLGDILRSASFLFMYEADSSIRFDSRPRAATRRDLWISCTKMTCGSLESRAVLPVTTGSLSEQSVGPWKEIGGGTLVGSGDVFGP